jgi:hypothetical protein
LIDLLKGASNVLRIRYEDLILKQEQTIIEVLQFLDVLVDQNIFRVMDRSIRTRRVASEVRLLSKLTLAAQGIVAVHASNAVALTIGSF